jgi:hypothetical protein
MLRVRIEPKVPLFERLNTLYALDCVATLIGLYSNYLYQIIELYFRETQQYTN